MAKSSRTETLGMRTQEDYQAESDLSVLMQARKIRDDPKRFAAAKALATTRLTEVAQIAGSTSDADGDE